MINLLIADDHEIYRDGLCMMLGRNPNFKVVGQAENGQELVDKFNLYMPDVVLTDIKMPILDGIDATKKILAKYKNAKILALSMFDDEHLIVKMMENGAKGYLMKNASKIEITEAINSANIGSYYYCTNTTNKLAHLITNSGFKPFPKKETIEFNEREIIVIKQICAQKTNEYIASQVLFVSKRTVEGYRQKIMDKLNVSNSIGIIIYALKNGLIDAENLEK
jgi:two-component system, NarL family, response regulator NreC